MKKEKVSSEEINKKIKLNKSSFKSLDIKYSSNKNLKVNFSENFNINNSSSKNVTSKFSKIKYKSQSSRSIQKYINNKISNIENNSSNITNTNKSAVTPVSELSNIEQDLQKTITILSVLAEKDSNFCGFDVKKEKKESKNKQIHRKGTGQIHQIRKNKLNAINDLKKGKKVTKNNSFEKIKKQKISIIKKLAFRKIERKKVIYDSLEDEEPDGNFIDGIYITPENSIIFIIDLLMTLTFLVLVIYSPIEMGLSKCFCSLKFENSVIYTELGIDLLFILDLIINFFKAYYNSESKLIKNNSLIAINYLKTWFIFDLLEAMPFLTISNYLCISNKYHPDGLICFENGINGGYMILKVLKLLKILRLFKIFNPNHNKALYKLYELVLSKNYSIEKSVISFIFTFQIYSIFHLLICFHIFLGQQTYPNWILLKDLQDSSFISLYITSFYFMITTMTTVGYGDIICSSFTELIFHIILLTIGIIAYSWIVSTVSNHFTNETKASIKFEKDVTLLEEIRISYPSMPFKLYTQIKNRLTSIVKEKQKCDLHILIDSLPYSLKNLILNKVYVKIIQNFKFFKNNRVHEDFISRVLRNFIPFSLNKDVYVVKGGESVQCLIFVQEGKLSLGAIVNQNDIQGSLKRFIQNNYNNVKYDKNNSAISHSKFNFEIFEKAFNEAQKNKDLSYLQDTLFDDEIEKLIVNEDDIGEKGDLFLPILNICKNEDYGLSYMLLDKKTLLSLKVKSKRADLFLLRKSDCTILYKAYPKIWKSICKKSYKNMIGIENRVITVIHNYCQRNGIMLNNHGDKYNPLSVLTSYGEMTIDKSKNESNKEKSSFSDGNDGINCRQKTAHFGVMISKTNTESILDIINNNGSRKYSKKQLKELFTFKHNETNCDNNFNTKNQKFFSKKFNLRKSTETVEKNNNFKLSDKDNIKNAIHFSSIQPKNVLKKFSKDDFNIAVNANENKNENDYYKNKLISFSDTESSKNKDKSVKIQTKKSAFFNSPNFSKIPESNKIEKIDSDNNFLENSSSINELINEKTVILKEGTRDTPLTISDLSNDLVKKIKFRINKNKNNKMFYKNLSKTLMNSMISLIKIYELISKDNTNQSKFFNNNILEKLSEIKDVLEKAMSITRRSSNESDKTYNLNENSNSDKEKINIKIIKNEKINEKSSENENFKQNSSNKSKISKNKITNSPKLFNYFKPRKLSISSAESFEYKSKSNTNLTKTEEKKSKNKIMEDKKNQIDLSLLNKKRKSIVDFILLKNKFNQNENNNNQKTDSSLNQMISDVSSNNIGLSEIRELSDAYYEETGDNLNLIKSLNKKDINNRRSVNINFNNINMNNGIFNFSREKIGILSNKNKGKNLSPKLKYLIRKSKEKNNIKK